MTRNGKGAFAFIAGFLLAAAPLTYWLLTLSYGDNGSKIALVIAIEFATGFASRAIYLRLSRSKNSN